MKDKTMMLQFKGKKAELHKQLKAYCAEAEQTMNGTVLELIEKLVIQNK